MTRIIRFAALALVVVTTQSAPPPASRGVPSADGTIRFSSDFVQMDVVVTDSKGRSVPNLEPADFEVREDGKLQAITAFSYVTRRTIVFIADYCDAFPYGTASTALFLRDFVDRRMQPDDSISIVPSTDGVGAFLRLTGDKQQLYAAIARSEGRDFFRVVNACPPQNNTSYEVFFVQGERGENGRRNTVYDLAEPYHGPSFSAVSLAIDGMASIPGRKNVILLSSAYGWLPFRAGTPAIQELADRANRAGVTVYVLDSDNGEEAPSDPAARGGGSCAWAARTTWLAPPAD